MRVPKSNSTVITDLLDRVPVAVGRILEIGCGGGVFGRAYLARNPLAQYVGVELCEDAAAEAATHLSHVIVGDVESLDVLAALDRIAGVNLFDVIIFSGVLDRLFDPWRVLDALRTRVAHGGVCIASASNVVHWSVLQRQLGWQWAHREFGAPGRAPVRYFTQDTLPDLFLRTGWSVSGVTALMDGVDETGSDAAECAVQAFIPAMETLGIDARVLRDNLSARQWLVHAANGPLPATLNVAASGFTDLAAVTAARIDYPFSALATQPAVSVVWGHDQVRLPSDESSGIFVIHRVHEVDAEAKDYVKTLIASGSVIVLDFDDDPRHWSVFTDSDFHIFRYVHAVTVSTPALAELVRQWNPNVQVLPNAIHELLATARTTPKQGERIRVFFGALNRGTEWVTLLPTLLRTFDELSEKVELVVVHDRRFFDALPSTIAKEFHPTLPHQEYLAVLSSCDIALLPLLDTPFNRMKSDLKFIECCAASVVPICSPLVYSDVPVHSDIGLFCDHPDEWHSALVTLCNDMSEIVRRRTLGLEYVKRERMHCQQVAVREHYYRDLMAHHEELELQRRKRLRVLNAVLAGRDESVVVDSEVRTVLHVSCRDTTGGSLPRGFSEATWRVIPMVPDATSSSDFVSEKFDFSGLNDESIDAVFSDHSLVQLYSHEVAVILAEFRRVLTVDGVIVVTCHDLQSVSQLIAEGTGFTPLDASATASPTPMDVLFGRQAVSPGEPAQTPHRCGFTEKTLVESLREAGFNSIVSGSRSHPHYDLWVVASICNVSEEAISALGDRYFPE